MLGSNLWRKLTALQSAIGELGSGGSSEDITAIQTAINDIKSDIANIYTKDETKSAIIDELSKIIADAPESLDTLKELADWIENHAESAAAMNSAIQDNAAAIEALQNEEDAKINGVAITGELDSQTDLKIPGKIVTGTVYQIDGEDVTAADGAEVFNDYTYNKATGVYSHAEGAYNTASGMYSHAEGCGNTASGHYSHAEGDSNKATGAFSHVEGRYGVAEGMCAHAEGSSRAIGALAHSEGSSTTASGKYSHAEGCKVTSGGESSHAEGTSSNRCDGVLSTYQSATNDEIITAWQTKKFTLAKGEGSHAEGKDTLALGNYSHAEGEDTKTNGVNSHAEGGGTRAEGAQSHAEGSGTIAASENQHVQGKYNVEDADDKYAFIIGNGSSSKRSNAIAIDWDGKIYVNNSETGVDLNTVIQDIANRYTKTETDSAIAAKIAEIIASAPESLDTLKEIADWIESHADSASAMNSDIQDNASAIAETNTKIDTVESSLKSEIETVTNDLTDDISAVETNMTNQIETVETNMTNQINTTNTAVNALQTDKMDKASIVALTLDEYNALAESEKTAEYYFIRED